MAKLGERRERKPRKLVYPDRKVIPIDRFLPFMGGERPKNRTYRIGCEMEGGWAVSPIWDGYPMKVKHDGSVFNHTRTPGHNDGEQIRPAGVNFIGEVVSKPLEPVWLERFITETHPTVVDWTCGLHVHMSFTSVKHYAMLMDSPSYQETMKHYLALWGRHEGLAKDHCLYKRLSGLSEYCTDNFWPDLQSWADRDLDRVREGNRYTILNYCFKAHETLECRVMPMMTTAAQSVRAAWAMIDIVNAMLAATAKDEGGRLRKERPASSVVTGDGETLTRSRRIVV